MLLGDREKVILLTLGEVVPKPEREPLIKALQADSKAHRVKANAVTAAGRASDREDHLREVRLNERLVQSIRQGPPF